MQVRPYMRLSPLPRFEGFHPVGVEWPSPGGGLVIRLVRFYAWKSVWFEDATESPNGRRNRALRLSHDHATP